MRKIKPINLLKHSIKGICVCMTSAQKNSDLSFKENKAASRKYI